MGVSGINSAATGATSAWRSAAWPIELVEFAVGQVLREGAAADAVAPVLHQLAKAAGCGTAMAFRVEADQELAVLAGYPRRAEADERLLAEIRALSAEHRDVAAAGGCFRASLKSAGLTGGTAGGRPPGILMAYSAPVLGRCPSAVALVRDSAGWDSESEATARILAGIIAVQIRHAKDTAELAEQAQLKLAEQNAGLNELVDAKTQFLATMSHELRTPLTSIVSFTELILDDEHDLSEDTVSSLSVIQRNAERLLRLVADLLLLGRLDAGEIPLVLAEVSVPGLIAGAVRSGSAAAAASGVMVEFSAADGPLIQADQQRLRQVLDNLLSNAIKFSGQRGRVRVEATHDGQMWRVDVMDDGIGIPARELDQLFRRFARASNARIAGLPGTGLGLSVVKAITELHGGRVEVRSTVGHGTTLSVYLPVSP